MLLSSSITNRSMYIASTKYIDIISMDLLLSSISFLILIILFKVKNSAVNIYLLIMLSMCIILSMNSKIFTFAYIPDNIGVFLDIICIFSLPFGYYLVYWIILKELTQYTILIMILYFATLSILHKVTIKLINNIKDKI